MATWLQSSRHWRYFCGSQWWFPDGQIQ
jgi:hypothetical protein